MVTTPALLRDLITRLAAKNIDFKVVAEFSARHALARRLKAIGPDLVVVGLRRSETSAVIAALLAKVPTAKFIALSANGRSIVGFELRLYQTDLHDASPDDMNKFIGSCKSGPGERIQPNRDTSRRSLG
jgi:DNA-binding NarL/FixJ family response regulator